MSMSSRVSAVTRLAFAAGLVATIVLSANPILASPRGLTGTWVVQVRLLTACTGGVALPPFWSVLTFARDGTLTGTTMSGAFAPGQRGPDHGTWTSAGSRGTYRAASLAFINFATPAAPPASPGFQSGVQRIDQLITPADADTFTSVATVTFLDIDSHPYRQGCAVATGRRFE
ncbi:MAG: hypothetical protein OEW19_22450 [Acidobacteriota bacterium]|nr:hypothetical protein [Acidobacteriota bacterium]